MEQRDNFCRRCLIREMLGDDGIKSIEDYVERIDPDIKTSDEEYERRLSLCKECESLLSGMCRVCGCFVAMRAAVKTHSCPGVQKRW